MDAGDRIRAIQAREFAKIKRSPANAIAVGQVPNNPPLTPDQLATIKANYPATDFANLNNIYPCGTSTICSTIYTQTYAVTSTMTLPGTTVMRGQYYNSTN
jgi:hypothetical protein